MVGTMNFLFGFKPGAYQTLRIMKYYMLLTVRIGRKLKILKLEVCVMNASLTMI